MATQKKSAFESALNFVGKKTSDISSGAQKSFGNFYNKFSRGYDNFVKTQNQLNLQKQQVANQYKQGALKLVTGGFNKAAKLPSSLSNAFKPSSTTGRELAAGFEQAKAGAKSGLGVMLKTPYNMIKNTSLVGNPVTNLLIGSRSKNDLTLGKLYPKLQLPGEKTINKINTKLKDSGHINLQKANKMTTDLPEIKDQGFLKNIQNPEWIKRGLLMNAPSFATSFLSGALVTLVTKNPVAGEAALFVTAFPQNAGEMYNDAIEQGADERTAQQAAQDYGMLASMLDTIGVGSILKRLPGGQQIRSKIIGNITLNLAKSALSEGSTEGTQQIVANALAKAYYDPQRPLFQEVPENAFFGGITGGVTSGITDVGLTGAQRYSEMTPEERQAGFVRTPFFKENFREVISTAKSPQEYIQLTNNFVNDAIKNAKKNDLKALRASLNQTIEEEIENVTGKQQNRKTRFALKQNILNTPEYSYLVNIEKNIEKIDAVLNGKKLEDIIPDDDSQIALKSLQVIENASQSEDFLDPVYGESDKLLRAFAAKYVDPKFLNEGTINEVVDAVKAKISFEQGNITAAPQATEGIEKALSGPTETPVDQGVQSTTPTTPLEGIEGGVPSAVSNEELKTLQDVPITEETPATPQTTNEDVIQEPAINPDQTLEPGEGQKERGLITSIKENPDTRENVKKKVSGVYDVTTDEGRMQAGREYIANNHEQALARALSNETLSNELVGIYYALDEQLNELADKADKAGDIDTANALDEQITALDNKLAEKATTPAQVLQFLHKWSQRSPQAIIRWAQKIFEQANEAKYLSAGRFINKVLGKEYKMQLTETQEKAIIQRKKEINRMPEGEEKRKATLDLMRDIVKDIPPSFLQKTDAYRYENMLISPRTQLKNVVSNIINTEVIYPSVLFQKGVNDFIFSHLKEEEQKYLASDALRYYRGQLNGLSTGIQEFHDILLGKMTGLDIDAKYDDSMTLGSLSNLKMEHMPWYLSVARRFLLGADRFFTNILAAGEKDIQLSKGKSIDEANKIATETAAYWLYTNKSDPFNHTGQGKVLAGFDRLKDGVNTLGKKIPGFRLFVPFVNIVFNTAKMQWEFNPITGPSTLIGTNRQADQIAKMQIGSYVMLAFAGLAANGLTSGPPPNDEKAREEYYASGRKPYSFYNPTTKQWIPVQYLGPLAWAAMLPIAFNEKFNESRDSLTDGDLQKAGDTLYAALRFFTEQTPISNVNGLLRVAEGDIDTSVIKNLGFVAGQFIPWGAMQRYVNTIIDPVFRKSAGFVDEIKKNIVGQTKDMEAYTTPTGEESKRNMSDYIAPFSIGEKKDAFEESYQKRIGDLQQTAITNAFKKGTDTGNINSSMVSGEKIPEKEVKARMKLFFETDDPEIRQQITQNLEAGGWNVSDAIELTLKSEREKMYDSLTPEAQKMLERSDEFTLVRKLIETYGGSPNTEQIIADKMAEKNISMGDMIYDNQTDLPDDVQIQEIESSVSGLTGKDLLAQLVEYRKISEGTRKALLTDTLIGKLQDRGIISEADAEFLKRVQWDADLQDFSLAPAKGGKKKSFKLDVPESAIKGNYKPMKINIKGPSREDFTPVKLSKSKDVYKQIKAKMPKIQTSAPQKKAKGIKIRTPVKTLSGLGGRG